jgi:hypothetical protein
MSTEKPWGTTNILEGNYYNVGSWIFSYMHCCWKQQLRRLKTMQIALSKWRALVNTVMNLRVP